MTGPVLYIRNLSLGSTSHRDTVQAQHGISLNVQRGKNAALVVESGSGKSVTARIVLGLLQGLRSARVTGEARFQGPDVDTMSEKDRLTLRGTDISMIFQDPTSALKPVFTSGDQFHEVLKRRKAGLSRAAALVSATEALAGVSIRDPARVLACYAFRLSGSMNQRVMIAMALANAPALLLADEPGTAQDVTVQDQTLRLMRDLVAGHQTSVLFISHNLEVVREFADWVYVIYRGRIVESGPVSAVFETPGHAYTCDLMAAVPRTSGGVIPELEEYPAGFTRPAVHHAKVRA